MSHLLLQGRSTHSFAATNGAFHVSRSTGTLIGLRHGVDLVRLMRVTAAKAGDQSLSNFLTAWLERREPLVDAVAQELGWFADRRSRKGVLIVAVLAWSGATFASAFATSFTTCSSRGRWSEWEKRR